MKRKNKQTSMPITLDEREYAYYGHTMSKQGSCLEKEIMQETMPCARRRGKPITAWMDNTKTWTDRTSRPCGRVNQNDGGQR